ncbi:MAG: helix-turn-helix transcriptional regulator [Bacteroidaceae bacterium]|nr:helix-turn-helix transcriptional regulator [Bacteroidaceae bacterium]
MNLMTTFKILRKAQKITQQQVADAGGFKFKAVICNYESGMNTPSIDTMDRLLDTIGYELTIVPKGYADLALEMMQQKAQIDGSKPDLTEREPQPKRKAKVIEDIVHFANVMEEENDAISLCLNIKDDRNHFFYYRKDVIGEAVYDDCMGAIFEEIEHDIKAKLSDSDKKRVEGRLNKYIRQWSKQ